MFLYSCIKFKTNMLKHAANSIIKEIRIWLALIIHFFSKVDWRVKGILLRGKEFSVSENGNCPRCQSNVIVFVILDEYVCNDIWIHLILHKCYTNYIHGNGTIVFPVRVNHGWHCCKLIDKYCFSTSILYWLFCGMITHHHLNNF